MNTSCIQLAVYYTVPYLTTLREGIKLLHATVVPLVWCLARGFEQPGSLCQWKDH